MEKPIIPTTEKINNALSVLNRAGYINHLWHEDDIQQCALDYGYDGLTSEELSKVKKEIEGVDCELGINWDTISNAINIIKNG